MKHDLSQRRLPGARFAVRAGLGAALLLSGLPVRAEAPMELALEVAAEAAARAGEAGPAIDAAMRAVLLAAGDIPGRGEHDIRVEPVPAGGTGPAAGRERVVKGAPYCAEAVHETVQWLPDPDGGAPNRIVRQNLTRLCRDGEGRTRQEVERGGRRIVYLRDPVAGEGWVLDPERKTARRLAGTRASLDAVADAALWRDFAEQMREWARATAEAAHGRAGVPPPPPRPAMPTPPAAPSATLAPAAPTAPVAPALITRGDHDVTVMRLDGGAPPRWEMPVPPPAVQWHASRVAPRGPGVTTALPARDFDGVRAHGERTTWVIEAGRVGNERPIHIVREVWTAPELLLTVSSRDFDPRSGEVNYRLRNLKRGEPDADLMRVPAGYTRQERGGSRREGASSPRG